VSDLNQRGSSENDFKKEEASLFFNQWFKKRKQSKEYIIKAKIHYTINIFLDKCKRWLKKKIPSIMHWYSHISSTFILFLHYLKKNKI